MIIMKYRIYNTIGILLLLLIVIACSEVEISNSNSHDADIIGINAVIQSPKVTRGNQADLSVLESEGSSFMVWGYFSPEAIGVIPGDLYMGDSHTVGTIINHSGTNWDYQNPAETAYWPLTSAPLNFQAVMPYDYGIIANNPSNGVPCVAMQITVPTDNSQQKDLLFGHDEEVTRLTNSGSVNLVFEHAMSEIDFQAVTLPSKISVEINGVIIHNVRNSATIGYTGETAGSRRTLAVSDYTSTVGSFAVGMSSQSVSVTSDTPVRLSANDGLLFMIPQSGTDSPNAWTTTNSAAIPLSVANVEGSEMSYIEVSCKVLSGPLYVIGSENNYESVYIPFKANWEIGHRYTYTLNFGSGTGGYSEDGTQKLYPVCFLTEDEENWSEIERNVTDLSSFRQWTDLPTLYIDTYDRLPITSKDDYKLSSIHYVNESGEVSSYNDVSVRGRGNSTWWMAKKPYRLKFDKKEKFLGNSGANSKKWNLLANAGDKTMIRNALTFALGKFTSLTFNPSTKFVDLVINGEYMGNYQITDQIEVKKKRVDIKEQPFPLTEGFDISGGYLMEVDGFKDGNYFITSTYSAPVRIRYPDEDDIVAEQNTYIKEYINSFESALASASFTDPLIGYRAFIDETSLIDWYICTEVSANLDGFWSTYFYKEQGDPKFYWGPLWDYDIAYDNDYRIKTERGVESSVDHLMSDVAYEGSKKWVQRMWQDSWFKTAVNSRYRELLDAGLVSYMLEKVDSLKTIIYKSQEQNYRKWGINTQMYNERVLYSTYDEYIDDLKTFITNHCAYLEEEFARRAAE